MAIYCVKCGARHECSVCPVCAGFGLSNLRAPAGVGKSFQQADELRAKFEAVAKGYGYCVDRYPMDGYWTGAYIREGVRELWAFWQAAYASRDAEVEALRKDAERYRWLVENCSSNGGLGVEIFIGDDAPDAIDLTATIDAAMREESK